MSNTGPSNRPVKAGVRIEAVNPWHVWWATADNPAGQDRFAEDYWSLPEDRCGGDGPWWDLKGTLEGDRWEWDGRGQPRDRDGNPVTNLVAWVEVDDRPEETEDQFVARVLTGLKREDEEIASRRQAR